MRQMKKFISIVMILVFTVTLTACKGNDRDSLIRNLDIETPVTVNVWYNDSRYENYLKRVAEEFKQANELVTINPVYFESDDFIETIYNETVQNNNAPDVYLMSSESCEKAYLLGLMMENDSYDDIYTESVYGKAALTACSYKGKLYGYPLTFNTSVMVYNKTYASPVESFKEIENINNNYEVTDENASIGMVFALDPSSLMLNYPYAGKYMHIGGEMAEDANSFSLEENKIKEAVGEFMKFRDLYGIERDKYTQDYCVDLFSQNKLMYTIVDSDHIVPIEQSEVEYGISEVPSLNGSLESKAMSVTTMAIVNPYTSDIQVSKAVARVLSYDYADEIDDSIGMCCARGDFTNLPYQEQYDRLHEIYADSVVKAKYIGVSNLYMRYEILLHQVWDGEELDTAYETFHNEVSGFLTQSNTPPQATGH